MTALARFALLGTVVVGVAAGPARAQGADSVATVSADSVSVVVRSSDGARPVATVPLPNGAGEFYYRSGVTGPARFRPRIGARRPAALPATAEDVDAVREELGLPRSTRPRGAAPSAGVTRLDLLLLERDLLDAIDRRLARLDLGGVSLPAVAGAPVVVLPGRPQPATPGTPTPTPATPARPVPATPGPVTVEEVERAVLETGLFRTTSVNFEFAQADLIPASTATLDVVADVLRRYPALRVEVGGHTDDRGSDATNDRLSQRRAESVASYLEASGVAANRLSAVGYGERRPVASNETETGRALNRRVEFTVLNPGAAAPRPAETAPATPALRDVIRQELERLRRDG
ncbi:OmpA family protein [Rubrivirga sp.]|uniref:OmpA family protein n=1 Tax=Rubrivirga sp. TaxID=1885344 RepID=UPI003B529A4D